MLLLAKYVPTIKIIIQNAFLTDSSLSYQIFKKVVNRW